MLAAPTDSGQRSSPETVGAILEMLGPRYGLDRPGNLAEDLAEAMEWLQVTDGH